MNSAEKTRRARERAEHPSREAIVFAARCSLLRRALRMTQVEFAERLGKSWLTVSRWERIAGHLPSRDSMARFERMEYEHKLKAGDPDPKLRIGE